MVSSTTRAESNLEVIFDLFLRSNSGSKSTCSRAQTQSKSVLFQRRVLPLNESIFFCYILATRIRLFLGLFSINFARTGHFEFTILSPLSQNKVPRELSRSLYIQSSKTDTQTHPIFQFKKPKFDRRI
jgi:hypothetical protein